MRLLRRINSQDFVFNQFYGDAIPPYAILSHVWGPEIEEPTFKDIKKGKGRNRTGFKKLSFCADQVENDGLIYFWVDTCCIDKSSSTELSEAINSMYRWYKNSTKCYVYLDDIHREVRNDQINDMNSDGSWKLAFQQSKWFRRGWTLQELLAPQMVQFFSKQGTLLGDKRTLEKEIHEVTKIDVLALRGASLEDFSINDRMVWSQDRVTTREEDAAYCLQGIFGVSMLPIYGEGQKKAFDRLNNEISRNKPCNLNLFDAIRQARIDLIEIYLKHSSFIDYATADLEAATPIHLAVGLGNDDVLKKLLEVHPRMNCYSGQGLTPLMLAATIGNTKAVERLLDCLCALNLPLRGTRQQPIPGIDIDSNSITTGSTALLLAAQNGHSDIVRVLLERNAMPNAATEQGFTPLMVAVKNRHIQCVKVLLKYGAETELKNHQGSTALICCANEGFVDIATILLLSAADIEAENDFGVTPLIEATYWGRIAFVLFLARYGASMSARCMLWPDLPDATALHIAVYKGNLKMVEALLQCGASRMDHDGKGRTAEDLARERGQQSIAEALKRPSVQVPIVSYSTRAAQRRSQSSTTQRHPPTYFLDRFAKPIPYISEAK